MPEPLPRVVCKCGQPIARRHVLSTGLHTFAVPTDAETVTDDARLVKFRCPRCRAVGQTWQKPTEGTE